MSFHVPEKHRAKHRYIPDTDSTFGNNGFFQFMISETAQANVIASDGEGWEHVSVSIIEDGKSCTPTWEEMCIIKSMFWDDYDCVIQYHPPLVKYVNNHDNVLHLWRPKNLEIPMPPVYMV